MKNSLFQIGNLLPFRVPHITEIKYTLITFIATFLKNQSYHIFIIQLKKTPQNESPMLIKTKPT